MQKITIAKGDGIGPEIMEATLKIIKAAGAQIETEEIEIGEKVYLSGNSSGISENAWDIIDRNKVFLKAPITTPQGGGYKSLNVTIRKMLGLYSNVRPCQSLHPFVETKHPKLDMVIIRENEEDLYAGIEHQQTQEVIQCLKLISKPGCEKIIRYAFEYARQYGRKKVTCFTKDNIMKQTDGTFHKIFDEIAKEYPEIENEHWIIDIGAARVAAKPEIFDVIVTLNLYGDIISDIAAEIAGSVGIAGSSNIGENHAMFEAIHGSAPDIAGQKIANPSGLLQGAVMMLNHIGQGIVAEKVHNAWLRTIEEGIHTADIYKDGISKKKVNTDDFASAVISNLGKLPEKFKAADFSKASGQLTVKKYEKKTPAKKDLYGVDLFVDWNGTNPNEIGEKLNQIKSANLSLSMITNRGIKVWPQGFKGTFCTDHWRCRFKPTSENVEINKTEIISLLEQANNIGVDVVKTENLYKFDGEIAFSLGQGQ
ncbi:MAG: NADP-dependent isocitrate dehydrogenase [Chitinophagaceae bacterium]|nr:MAG: NADP-dependent isocitrate dehydrogenase [Chitinophagaceae bacterium]